MTKACIIGDNFMLASVFEEKLIKAVGADSVQATLHSFNWPGDPLVHGHTTPGMEGLKEYFGDAEEVLQMIGDAEILITHLAPVSRKMLTQLPDLKFIGVSRGGPVNVDVAACRERGVYVVNTPGRNASAVAEFTIGAIIAHSRNVTAGHEGLRKAVWSDRFYRADHAGLELSEITVGIVGYGAIGRLVVNLLKAFGSTIIVSDPYAELSEDDIAYGVRKAPFDDLLAQSDVVSLHSKVTPETVGLMNAQTFAQMKRGAILINTTRGSLCDEAAMVDALRDGQIGGAVLDTFATEPLPADHPLLSLPNVTLTPHIAGSSYRTVAFAAEQVAEDARRYLAGEPLVNPQ